ncbi:MAG: sigma-70 family RNA polymerase sigma factor [Gammaproteobacteria bacterium]|nr:sigma-70 family RNA polymerase sigma factor [Gammaproteobacteria bacterium]
MAKPSKKVTMEAREAIPHQASLDLYLRDIRIAPLLSFEEEIYYGRLSQQGDIAARHRMIESNLRLVVKMARRYLKSGIPLSDLIAEGNVGLMRAADKFDPERGFRFSTYSSFWIQQSIEESIMSQKSTICVPIYLLKKMHQCLKVSNKLSKNMHQEPSAEHIASHMGKTSKEVEGMLALNEKIISIDMPCNSQSDKTLSDTLGTELQQEPIAMVNALKLKRNLERWLSILNSRHRAILERRFGLNGFDSMTLDETGHCIGLTTERVRQLQNEAMQALRLQIESQGNNLHSLLI